MTLSLTINDTLKLLSSLPILMRGRSGGDSVAIGIYSPSSPSSPAYPLPSPFSPSLISLMVSVDVKHHVYLLWSSGDEHSASISKIGSDSIHGCSAAAQRYNTIQYNFIVSV